MNRKQINSSQSGFTLMEIIVVFMIITFVITYSLGTGIIGSRTRARDTARKTHLANIARALELYINDHGVYPSSNSSGQIVGCGNPATPTACAWGSEWTDSNGTKYMTMPKDPLDAGNYFYTSDGVAWQIYAKMEKDDDPDIDNNGDGDYVPADDDFTTCGTASACSCGIGDCNYGVSSGNTSPGTVL